MIPVYKQQSSVDLLFYNGIIYTANSDDLVVDALAVRDGTIVFAGSNKESDVYREKAAEIIDLNGKMILPGFIDTHLHAPGRILTDLYKISLYEASDEKAIINTIANFINANPDLEIYYGEGFSIGVFSGEEVSRGPRKEKLDLVCPAKPVVIYSSDCHLAWLNSKALEVFSISQEASHLPGGIIEKDPVSGELWGTLKETAMRLVPEQKFSETQTEQAMQQFQQYMHSFGYTGIMSISMAALPPLSVFRSMEERGALKLHVNSSLTIDPEKDLPEQFYLLEAMREEYNSDRHTVSTAKIFADGVIEGATAYLSQPYHGAAGKDGLYRGEFLWDRENLKEAICLANSSGFQVHIHSIGDASTSLVLDALQQAKELLPDSDCRNLITHLQLVDPTDIPRFKELDIIASTQPYWHCKEPGWWEIVDYPMLGERAEKEYPMQSFIQAGVLVVSSSDHPVTPVPNPLRAIRAGVTRNLTAEESYGLAPINDIDHWPGLLNKSERVSLTNMIKSFTINSAYAIFRENITGTLERGKSADLVILDRDLFDVDPLLLEKVQVLKTYFNGELVYDAEQ